MSGWILQAWRKGLVTTSYPTRPPTDDEVPATGRAPSIPPGTGAGSVLAAAAPLCPTSAIGPDGLQQGQCIRCARCRAAGIVFEGNAETAATSPAALVWPGGQPLPTPSKRVAPLADLRRSVHVFLMDVGSCQACNLEVLGLANPYYDSHRLGIAFTNSPRHADILVVVGVPTTALVEPLRRTFEAMPGPKAVLAVGACALDGGIFAGAPGTSDPVRSIVPVDLFVPGCPPPPIAVLDGLLTLLGRSRTGGGGSP